MMVESNLNLILPKTSTKMYYPDIVDPKVLKTKTISLDESLRYASASFDRLCQFFGASPIENQHEKISPNTSFIKSIKSLRFTVVAHRLWCSTYMISVVYCMFIQHQESDYSKHELENFLYVDSYILKAINLLLVLSGNHHHRCDNFFKKITAFDERLLAYVETKKTDAVQSLLSYERFRVFLWRGVAVAACVLGSSIVIDWVYNDYDFLESARSCFVYIVPNITFALSHVQYLGMLQLLRWRSQQINVSLKHILSADDGKKANSNSFVVGISSKSKPYSINVSLNEIRLLHLEMNSLIQSLGEAFEYVLVAFFASSILVVTITLFTIYIMVHYWDGNFRIAVTVYTVIWAFLYMGQIGVCLHFNDRLNQEVIALFLVIKNDVRNC